MNGAAVKEHWPLIVAGLLVVVAIVLYSKGGTTTQGTTLVQPNTSSTDAANAQIAAGNAASATAYNQQIGQEFSQLVGFGTTVQNNITGVDVANIQAGVQKTQYNDQLQASNVAQADQLKTSQDTIAAQEKVAALEAQVQQTQANDQLAAQQAQANSQSNSNFFNGLFSFGATLAGIFG